jgi:hypothetical protein
MCLFDGPKSCGGGWKIGQKAEQTSTGKEKQRIGGAGGQRNRRVEKYKGRGADKQRSRNAEEARREGQIGIGVKG